MKKILAILTAIFLSNQLAYAYEGPSPLRNVRVDITLSFDSTKGLYQYNYKFTNPSINDGEIGSIAIFLPRNAQNDAILPAEGLSHCSNFLKSTLGNIFQKMPIVPVGSDAPKGWLCSYQELADYPSGSYGWGAKDEPYLIKSGAALGGFLLTSYGLPGIQDIVIEPDIDIERLPPEYNENLEKTVALHKKVKWASKTVAPKAPPKVFVATDFIKYIASVKEQASALGWIKKGIEKSLDAKLDEIEKKILAGEMKSVKHVIDAFLNEVEAQNGKGLTSEGHALLFYNGKYLLGHLPNEGQSGDHKDKKKDGDKNKNDEHKR